MANTERNTKSSEQRSESSSAGMAQENPVSLVNPYVAGSFIKIHDYENNMDPNRWLKMFEANLNVVGVPNSQKLDIVPGYFKSDSLAEWFFNQNFEDWETFKIKFSDRLQSSKASPNVILKALLSVKRKDGESMR
ncbi:unnamed protein product [Mucor hiemalis]